MKVGLQGPFTPPTSDRICPWCIHLLIQAAASAALLFPLPDSNRDTRSRGRQAVNTLPYSRCCGFRCTVNSIHPSAQVGRHLPGLSWSQFYHRTAFYAKEEYRVIANGHCWPLPKKQENERQKRPGSGACRAGSRTRDEARLHLLPKGC